MCTAWKLTDKIFIIGRCNYPVYAQWVKWSVTSVCLSASTKIARPSYLEQAVGDKLVQSIGNDEKLQYNFSFLPAKALSFASFLLQPMNIPTDHTLTHDQSAMMSSFGSQYTSVELSTMFTD